MDAARPRAVGRPRALAWGPIFLSLCGLLARAQPRQVPPDPADSRSPCRGNETHYYRTSRGACCSRCPPGSFISSPCTGDRDTLCSLCPANSYNQYWNHLHYCQLCRSCDEVLGFEQTSPCRADRQTECRCRRGTYCPRGYADCDHCVALPSCPPGTEAAFQETGNTVPACVPCTNGTFQNTSLPAARCQPHTDCQKQGLRTETPGTAEADARCQVPASPPVGSPTPPTVSPDVPTVMPGPVMLSVILLPVVSVGLVVLTLLCALKRHPSLCRKLGFLLKTSPETPDIGPRASLVPPDLVEPLLRAQAGPVAPVPAPVPPPVPAPVPEEELLQHRQNPQGQARELGPEAADRDKELHPGTSGFHVTGGSVTVTGNIYIYNLPPGGGGRSPGDPQASPEPPYPIPEEGAPGLPSPFGPPGLILPHQEDGKAWHTPEAETPGQRAP
ncbi:tumor necrosis factor receptor superfamily member 3 isoform X2 [Ornithorhynchus anatinus]|uniref:Lymphotoxin beta receptor n=1 Tax=Ornithorhynchus anatinus TaxID=9258 RepID=A0A6I8PB38_ORNAN|nr:tumor necrosis factor receptor superfamily member 3 isoform X2 [Ornithorhynchus anatinus]